MTEFLAFIAIGIFEYLRPWRAPVVEIRWLTNVLLAGLNLALTYVILPGGLAGVALYASRNGVGLFQWLALPGWLQVGAGVLLLDATAYGLHVIVHRVHFFWRFHVIHHADPAVDATTGFRHHPGELVLTAVGTSVAILALGIPATAVLFFGGAAALLQIIQHGNLKVPRLLDRALRLVIVTPDVHRIHHSLNLRDSNTNFGTGLLWWDYLFGTYLPLTPTQESSLSFGVQGFTRDQDLAFWRVLLMPAMIRRGSPDSDSGLATSAPNR